MAETLLKVPLLKVEGLQAWYGESHILHGVEFDVPAFHLGHPPLGLAKRGGEVGLRHAEAEPCAACATADTPS